MRRSSLKPICLHGVLVLAGGAAGWASGCLSMPMAWRGMVLGIGLALGTTAVNLWSRRHLQAGRPPDWWVQVVCGAGAGLASGVILGWAMPPVAPNPASLVLSPEANLAGWPTLLMALAHGLCLLLVAGLRWRSSVATFLLPLLLAVASALVVFGRELVIYGTADLASGLFAGVLGGFPFGLLWGLASVWFDPAFTYERWQRFDRG